jgi:succinoglycan biosynthesis transport protein ExoP
MSVVVVWAAVRRFWWLLVVCTVLAGVGAWWFASSVTPLYRAQAELFVSAGGDDGSSGAYQGGLFVQQRVDSYTQVAQSPVVLEPVIGELGLDVSADELAEDVTARAGSDTVILEIEAVSDSPREAADIADAVSDQTAVVVADLESRGEEEPSSVKMTVIREAEVPGQPFEPRVALSVVLGVLGGLGLGFALALMVHVMDRTVRTREQAGAVDGVSVLGVISAFRSRGSGPAVAVSAAGPAAEAYRAIRTNLRYIDVDQPVHALVVTSPEPGEGKSTTALNLAAALGRDSERVLLIDADLRRPSLASGLGLVEEVGLTTALVDEASLDQLVQPISGENVDLLGSGPVPPNPSELLSSRAMEHLLSAARERYATIIIDSAPVLPVTDAAVLSRHADGVVVVARYARTRRDRLAEAIHTLRAVDARLVGLVLNRVPASTAPTGYQYVEQTTARRRPWQKGNTKGRKPRSTPAAPREKRVLVRGSMEGSKPRTKSPRPTPSAQTRPQGAPRNR